MYYTDFVSMLSFKSGLRKNGDVTSFAVCLLVVQVLHHRVSAGTCWLMVSINGKCQTVSQLDKTKEECCQTGYANMGWTPHENPSAVQLFQWQFLQDGAPQCQPCHGTCDRVRCAEGRRCEVRNGRARCVCAPDCSSLHYPEHLQGDRKVCGSDERTYRNHCSLLKHNCRSGAQVYLDYYGRCQRSCDGVVCPSDRHCVVDQNGLPHCIPCITHCASGRPQDAVCGENGVTYESFCHYNRHICQHGSAVGIAYHSPCLATPTCNTINCFPDQQCLVNPQTNLPQCVSCDEWCSEEVFGRRTVCGTDDRTYDSWCQMMRSSCNRGIVIRTQHSGPCGGQQSGPRDDEEIGSEDDDELFW